MSLQLLVIMVPVIFGFMGFAIDLGRLYLVKGELNQAATGMAVAAAGQLIGTVQSTANATIAAQQSLDNTNGFANKYNFGSLLIGQTTGNLVSTVNPPGYFALLTDALGSTSGGQADGTTARHAQITLLADAPLLFWGILSVAQSRKTSVGAIATAGISAPLCTACGIEPFAIGAIDPTNADGNFGFGDPSLGTLYTLAFDCTGSATITPLTGTSSVVRYVIINRWDPSLDESQNLYRDGAAGLVGSSAPNPTGSAVPIACVGINDPGEMLWTSATPQLCTATLPVSVTAALCGLYSRFDNSSPPTICTADVTDFATVAQAYLPDTDCTGGVCVTGQTSPYINYIGNGRRIVTLPIMDALTTTLSATMTVLGFRQFLVEPNADGSLLNPSDPNGRFAVMYIGSPAPVKQGYVDDRFGLSCPAPVSGGPGKVVLHQ